MALTIRRAHSADAQLILNLIIALARYEREEHSVKVTVDELARQMQDLFVLPHQRGTGAGGKLMSYLAGIANENDCARFEWSVLDWNEPAIGFYTRIGAKPVTGRMCYRVDPRSIAC